MLEENEVKERIFNAAEQMFFQHGFAKVTMDEIASSLGMSKKTLYKFFSGKENLLKELIYNRQCETEEHINQIWANQNMDFVGKLKKMMDFLGEQSSKIKGPLFDDLRKNMPEVWNELHDFKKIKGLQKATELFNKGVENGVFRKDINRDMVILIYTSAIQTIINPETLAQLPFSTTQAIEKVFTIIFEGIFTEEGRAKYISYKSDTQSNKE